MKCLQEADPRVGLFLIAANREFKNGTKHLDLFAFL